MNSVASVVGGALACLLLLSGSQAAATAQTEQYANWTLTLLTEAARTNGALCLDGTAPGYYVEAGWGDGASRWLLHWQGGGWCTSLSDCVRRSTTALGSSKSFSTDKSSILGTYDGGAHGIFSSDPAVNPDFWNWNKVYVRYCDGASFGGNVDAPVHVDGHTIYFRGRRVLDATLDDLLQRGLAKATDFLVNGCSAGGLATWLHLDYIASRMPSCVDVRGVPECGFFMDEHHWDGEAGYTPLYQTVDKMQNVTGSGSANAGCLAVHSAADRWKCFMAQYTLPHIKTPFFAVNSVYDAWQASNIIDIPSSCASDASHCNAAQLAAFNGLRSDMLSNLTANVDSHQSVYWTYNCVTHCGQLAHDDRWGVLQNADGTQSLRSAVGDWWYRRKPASSLSTAAKAGWGEKGNPTCRD